MEWWGPSRKIEQFDRGDELLIRVSSIRRKGDVLLVGVGTSIGVFVCIAKDAWAALLGVLVLGVVFAWSVWANRVRELLVTAGRLRWHDSRLWSTEGSLLWKDVFSLRYESGGEDGPTGLCARTGRWTSICIIDGVGSSESEDIIRMISSKFPDVEMAPEPEGFLTSFRRAIRGD